MKLLRRLACWLGLHALPPGVMHEWSICWACRNCGHLTSGGLAERKRR
jgi:hypothetical protein